MEKSGFTLIEIIVSVVLLTIIGSTVLIYNKKNNGVSEDLSNKIYEAANVFIALEKDENNITYENGIKKGGKALQFTVNDLADKGYVDESIVKTLEEKTGDNRKNLYILASNSILEANSDECGTDFIQYKGSWDKTKNNPVYLCPYDTGTSTVEEDETEEDTNIRTLYGALLENGYKEYDSSNMNFDYASSSTNGIGLYKMNDFYFFRGHISNNYINFSGHTWQIVNFDNKGAKLIYYGENTLNASSGMYPILNQKLYNDGKYSGNRITDYKKLNESNFKKYTDIWHDPGQWSGSELYVNVTTKNYRYDEEKNVYVLTGDNLTPLYYSRKKNIYTPTRVQIDRDKIGDYVYTCAFYRDEIKHNVDEIWECNRLEKVKVDKKVNCPNNPTCNSGIGIYYLDREPVITANEDSNLKIKLEDWYKTEISNNGNDVYLSKENTFCSKYSYDVSTKTYTYDCQDGYSTDTYPVALINYDDAVLSGIGKKGFYYGASDCKFDIQNINYLSSNRNNTPLLLFEKYDTKYYTLLPIHNSTCNYYATDAVYGDDRVYRFFELTEKETYQGINLYNGTNLRPKLYPSIYLSSNISVTGNGTEMYPYEIATS